MIDKTLAIALLTAMIPVAATATIGTDGALERRFYVAEIPPATAGGGVRVGVLLPLGAKIAKTQVQVAATALGDEIDGWADCDVETKACDLAGTEIVRFHRDDTDNAQELAADMRNVGGEPRYVKLTVLFQPQSGSDRSGCEDKEKCGFSRPVFDD